MKSISLRTMRFAAACVLALLAAPLSANSTSAAECPLADAPYSADTPMMDLLLDTRAKSLIDAAGISAKVPSAVLRTSPPSFSSIISLRIAARILSLDEAVVSHLDQKLAALPIRPEDKIARCARYEADNPAPLEVAGDRPAMLIFDRSNGFRDDPSVQAATQALRAIGERNDWTFIFSSSAGDFTTQTLSRFKAVLWNNVSGDMLTLGQRKALKQFVEDGGGFAAIHGSGGDPLYLWDWYADELIGARFTGHPDTHQKARVTTENAAEPLTMGIANEWSPLEEWYSFAKSPRGRNTRVLLSLDENSYVPVSGERDLRMGDHPVAWVRCVGKGRSFYSAIGHRPDIYSDPNNVRLIEQGIAWAMGLVPSGCINGVMASSSHTSR